MKKVEVIPFHSCWEWVGHKGWSGYGACRYPRHKKGKVVGAHRLSFEIFKGAIPTGAIIMHTCDNRGCVNPNHLIAGTYADNNKDMANKNRSRYGSDHPRAKLSVEKVLKIREASGVSQRQLASIFGVCHATIGGVKSRKYWRHV